jgi:hypothetical protein
VLPFDPEAGSHCHLMSVHIVHHVRLRMGGVLPDGDQGDVLILSSAPAGPIAKITGFPGGVLLTLDNRKRFPICCNGGK